MPEGRRLPPQTKNLYGRLYFNNGHDSLPCRIVDGSYEGARITIFDRVALPDVVELYLPEKSRIVHASVRWRHGKTLGLAFSEVSRPAKFSTPNLHRPPAAIEARRH